MITYPIMFRSQFNIVSLDDGECIETKVERVTTNREPINESAPIIFTERKDGVQAAYDIRTDRYDIALTAMDKVNASRIAKNKNWLEPTEVGKPESPARPSGTDLGESTVGKN